MSGSRQYLGKLVDEFTIAHVGSTLLEELAKGVYEPDEVIREYIQNAVDAHRLFRDATGSDPEHPIHVEIHGTKLSFFDNGIGMDEEEVRNVKAVAVSRKRDSYTKLTGHKGVGIWAGLSFFTRLSLVTTKSGSDRGFELTIEFKKIVDSLSPLANIGEVLNPNYEIKYFEADREDHYTIVTLEDPDPSRSPDRFLETTHVVDAVRRICPCELDPTFVFHQKVLEFYSRLNVRLYPILVNGQRVFKMFPSAVERFEVDKLTINDNVVAEYWVAVNQEPRILKHTKDQLIGFRLIDNGFALGGANPYSEADLHGYTFLPRNNYVNWHIGEIHITSPELRPTLKRNKLEESEDSRQFIERLRNFYRAIEYSDRALAKKHTLLETYAKHRHKADELSARPLLQLSYDEQSWVVNTKRALQTDEEGSRSKKRDYDVEALRDHAVRDARIGLQNALNALSERHLKEAAATDQPIGTPGTEARTNTISEGDSESSSGSGTDVAAEVSQQRHNNSAVSDAHERETHYSNNDSTTSGGHYDHGSDERSESQPDDSDDFDDNSEEDVTDQLVPIIQTLLQIVGEVLDEELASDSKVQQSILGKVRTRLYWMASHE